MQHLPEKAQSLTEPSIYVDPAILKSTTQINSKAPLLEINGDTFSEIITTGEDFREFNVEFVKDGKKTRLKMDDFDVYCSTPTDSGSDYEDDHNNSEVELKVTLSPVPNGYIVNNSCFLTWQQWNTMVTAPVSAELIHCVVCASYCEPNAAESHVNTVNHRAALKSFPPLEKMDLSITRKIRNEYHCGVCNEVFDLKDEYDHYSGKMHEGNLLYAINKASDLLDNYGYSSDHNGNNKSDTYHFKNNNNININDNESVSESLSSDHDNFRYVNFQSSFNYDDFDENLNEVPVFTGVSYANIAKTPKAATQTFLDVDLGNKKVKVSYDSWHMVISPKANNFWCMACKKLSHMRKRREHCEDDQHLANLRRCAVVESYVDFFIRQVDDKLYHCGHCNRLQIIHEMDDHIESSHKKSTSKLVTDAKTTQTPTKNTENNNMMTNEPKSLSKDGNSTVKLNEAKSVKSLKFEENSQNNNIITNPNNANHQIPFFNIENPNLFSNNNISHKMPGIFDNIEIFPFGYKMTIPSLSYNIVCKRLTDFYCGLCDLICQEKDISRHVFEVRHLELLQRTPFIAPFSYHLIRAIRDALHCAICNMPITAAKIYIHIQDQQHTEFLNRALNQNKIPPIGVKIPNVPENPKPIVDTSKLNQPPKPTLEPTNSQRTNEPETPKVLSQNNNNNNNYEGINNSVPNSTEKIRIDYSGVENENNIVKSYNEKIRNINNNLSLNNNNAANFTNNGNVDNDYVHNDTNYCRNDTNNIRMDTKDIRNDTNNVTSNTSNTNNSIIKEIIYTKEEEEDEFETDSEPNNTFDSVEDVYFDIEEYVYIKLKNSYIKVTNASYNTLVSVGDGSRYCFVCECQVPYILLQKHVDSRSHLESLEMYRFLDKYEDHLLRQIYLMYHCTICNVIIARKELKNHLEWPTHTLHNENITKNIKKTRKNDIKGGIKQVVVSTQKENIYLHENETKIKIGINAAVIQAENKSTENRKNKIIIFNDNVLKFPWEHWNGVVRVKNGYKCNLCQRDLKASEVDVHCNTEWHKYSLNKPFEKQYAPALVRKINETTLNCVICNTEMSNKDSLVQEHINGKRHAKNHDTILKESSQVNSYTDCQPDVLTL